MYIFPLNHYHFLETAPSLNLCHPILFIYFPNSQNCLISPNNMFYPDMTSLLSILHEEGPQGVMRPNFLQPSINQLERIPKVLNSAFFPAVKHICRHKFQLLYHSLDTFLLWFGLYLAKLFVWRIDAITVNIVRGIGPLFGLGFGTICVKYT